MVLFRHFIVFFVRTFYCLGMLIHMHYECSYHLAEKKIPSIHGQTVGFKLEQFIFDAFPYAPSTALFEVTFLPFSLIQVLQFPFLSFVLSVTFVSENMLYKISGVAWGRVCTSKKCQWFKLWHPRQCPTACSPTPYTMGDCCWWLFDSFSAAICNW